MRIGIDGHYLGSRSGGNETYTRGVLRGLAAVAGGDEIVVFTTGLDRGGPRVDPGPVRYRPLWRGGALWRQCGGLAMAALRERVDVLLAQYWAPFFLPGSKMALVVHDVGHRYHPEHFTPAQRLRLEAALRSGVRRARRVCTVSEHARRSIAESYGVPLERIVVTHNGVDRDLFQRAAPDRVDEVRRRLGLPRDYLLFVGNLMPRKNVERLIRACALLRGRSDLDPALVVVGRRRWMTREIFEEVGRVGLTDRVIFTGYVERGDLPAIYSGAAAHVQPSLFEGFGITLVEAMACGTPVVASAAAAIPEVVGDAGVLFDAHDEEQMAVAISRALTDEALRSRLVDRGYARAAEFSWERCAEETLAALRAVVAGA